MIYHNQAALIDGYDNEILSFLLQAKTSRMEEDLVRDVKNFDAKMTETQDKIINVQLLIIRSRKALRTMKPNFKYCPIK